jgi:hypothetical protein
MSDIDFSSIDIDAALGSDFALPVESVEAQPSPAEPVAPTPEPAPTAPAPEPQPPAGWNPDGPGDVRVALRQAREEARMYQEQLAALQAQAQQTEQPTVDPLDPEAHQFYMSQIAAIQSQMQGQLQQYAMQQSVDMARRMDPEYDNKIAFLYQMSQHPVLGGRIDFNSLAREHSPAQAALQIYDELKYLDPNFRSAEVQRQVAEALKNAQPQKTQAPATLSSMPSAAPNDSGISLDKLTKADYMKYGLDILDMLG